MQDAQDRRPRMVCPQRLKARLGYRHRVTEDLEQLRDLALDLGAHLGVAQLPVFWLEVAHEKGEDVLELGRVEREVVGREWLGVLALGQEGDDLEDLQGNNI